jgi:glycosyltransferase involved in cell wall biosynthesis
MTRACVENVLKTLDETQAVEVIVVDDYSPVPIALTGIDDSRVQLVRTPENLRFSRACNYGASQASGRYLLFLNKLLPGIVYLFNIRDAAEAARSGWWPGNESAEAVIATTNEWLIQAADDLNDVLGPGRAAVLEYGAWNDDPERLIEAYAAVGLPRDDAAVRAAVGERLDHGPHSG